MRQPLLARYGVTSTCRASFGLYNTLEEVDALAEALDQGPGAFRLTEDDDGRRQDRDRSARPNAPAMAAAAALPPEEIERLTDEIVAALKTVYDPEIPADIYELGLIYRSRSPTIATSRST